MFSGETAVELTTGLSREALHARVEEALAGLGRVRVDRLGGLTVVPHAAVGSFLTDVQLDGTVRPLGDGGYEVAVRHTCRPTAACWVIAAVLLVTTAVGAGLVFVPLLEKKPVAARVRLALARLEDAADDRPG